MRSRGGHGAWPDIVAAIHHEGYLTRAGVMQALGVKAGKVPPVPDPPEVGWKVAAVEREARLRAKSERWLARQ